MVIETVVCVLLVFAIEGQDVEIVGTDLVEEFQSICEIKQITFSLKNHELDNNDNFSFDDRFICYDTRGTFGSGIENGISIEIVDIITGREFVIYSPSKVRLGSKPAPGVGAVSFHPSKYSVVFIHGPDIGDDLYPEQISVRDIYAKNNRRGKIIDFEFDYGKIITKDCGWVDFRSVNCESGIPPGVHRGGSHRHEYSLNGVRIGCTYDDFLLVDYGRTIAFFEPILNSSSNSKYFFSVILKPVPINIAKSGDIVKAYGDSWIDKDGMYRGFIGTVKTEYGFEDHLFIAEIPQNIDLTTARSGNCKEYPEPPKGIKIVQIYDKWVSGIVRGSPDGKRLAFLAKDDKGKTQIFIADLEGIYQGGKEWKITQLTNLREGIEDNFRWHPSGKWILSVSNGAIVATSLADGENFGESLALTPSYRKNKPYAIVVSRSGKYLAFNRRVPTYDSNGNRVFDSSGLDFSQIFLLTLPKNVFN